MSDIKRLPGAAFLPFPDMEKMLLSEFRERLNFFDKPDEIFGNLLYFKNFPIENIVFPYWAKCVFTEPFTANFNSIGEAASILKGIQRNWASYQYQFFRRSELLQEKLPYINFKEKKFPVKIPKSPIGCYTLTSQNSLIASAVTNSFLPAGSIQFVEDHENPPSRAYLKLQEALAVANLFNGTDFPSAESRCFEAGACPGGWTWVLTNLGARVVAVDRSELDIRLMKNPLVEFIAHDAFTLNPEDIGFCDWVFSDVICYPERLYEWILKWLKSNLVKNMICTIKMQGKTDWSIIKKFEEIDGSKILHLNYNKHELTWIRTV